MAHFAELDENNVVLRTLVVDNKDILGKDQGGHTYDSERNAFIHLNLTLLGF
jgi:hypothetical protein